jgi:hypothetical protein
MTHHSEATTLIRSDECGASRLDFDGAILCQIDQADQDVGVDFDAGQQIGVDPVG